jgi:hypothetical protein
MIMSVSTLITRSGAATEVSFLKGCMAVFRVRSIAAVIADRARSASEAEAQPAPHAFT